MGKKKAFTKGKPSGGAAGKKKLDPFKVSDKRIKKKTKPVKSNINKIKANVKVQQEKSDAKLKSLHADMVVKKPKAVPIKKGNDKKKRPAATTTRPVRDKLQRMQV